MTATDIAEKMRKLSEFILDAEAKVRSGKMVDITSIDGDINLICARATSLPPAQALEIQPLMAELISNLERLGIALKDFKENLK